jgi:hypothetical protein
MSYGIPAEMTGSAPGFGADAPPVNAVITVGCRRMDRSDHRDQGTRGIRHAGPHRRSDPGQPRLASTAAICAAV